MCLQFHADIIVLKKAGIVADLGNPHCNTDVESLMNIFVCFESSALPLLNGCFNGFSLLKDYSTIGFYIENNYLWIKSVNTSMNETLINVFCLSDDDINCNASDNVKIMILNSELST